MRKVGAIANRAIFTLVDELGADAPEKARRLLVAALDSFAEHGFEAATTRDIADRVGLSPAGVYIHYRRKVDLLYELSRIGHLSALDAVNQADAAGDASPAAELRRFVAAYVSWHAEFHTLARVAQYELGSLDGDQLKEIRRLRRQFRVLIEKLLERGEEAGEFTIVDRRGTARAILSLGVDVARWYDGRRTDKPKDIGALYGDLVLRMVSS